MSGAVGESKRAAEQEWRGLFVTFREVSRDRRARPNKPSSISPSSFFMVCGAPTPACTPRHLQVLAFDFSDVRDYSVQCWEMSTRAAEQECRGLDVILAQGLFDGDHSCMTAMDSRANA